jgi:hypothetical protein
MNRRFALAAAVGALAVGVGLAPLASAAGGSQPQTAQSGQSVQAAQSLPTLTALAAQVDNPPNPVLGTDNRRHLVYEIALINPTPFVQRVDRVEVLDAAHRALASYSGPTAVRSVLTLAGDSHAGLDVLPASASAMVWLDVSFAANARVPSRLVHRIDSTLMTSPARHFTLNGASTAVSSRAPVGIGSPLVGARYVDANGCCGESPHTRALLTLDGKRYLAQRFAIDWVRIDGTGRAFVGDKTKNEDWLVFGDSVAAAGSGVVVDVLNTLPENTPPTPLANLTAQNALGNHVIENLGGGRYALYAHLQTGSVAVRVGQRLHRGQFLGRVGNTGSSTAPHLHFHVTDGPDVLASNGVPYVFDSQTLTGRVLNLDAFASDENPQPAQVGLATPPFLRRNQLPLQTDVVTLGR